MMGAVTRPSCPLRLVPIRALIEVPLLGHVLPRILLSQTSERIYPESAIACIHERAEAPEGSSGRYRCLLLAGDGRLGRSYDGPVHLGVRSIGAERLVVGAGLPRRSGAPRGRRRNRRGHLLPQTGTKRQDLDYVPLPSVKIWLTHCRDDRHSRDPFLFSAAK